jgi:uridine phosphorylase
VISESKYLAYLRAYFFENNAEVGEKGILGQAPEYISFMDTAIINPSRMSGEPQLDGSCLFFVNPGETRSALQQAKNRNGKKHFLFHSNFFELPGKTLSYIAGPALGSPMAVLTLEKLIALGAKEIVVYGWCGSLHSSVKTGDIVLPTGSISEEGTSVHYPIAEQAESDKYLRQKLTETLQTSDHTIHSGPVWTTDAPFRETRKKIKDYSNKGLLAVDMEFSALCTVATFRKVKLAAVMLVSDELWHTDWQPGFQSKKFRRKSHDLMGLLLDSLTQ